MPKERRGSANLRDVERLGKGKTQWEQSVWRSGVLCLCWRRQVLEVCVLGRLPSRSKIIATVFSAVYKSSINLFQTEEAFLTLLQLFLNLSSSPSSFSSLDLFVRLCILPPVCMRAHYLSCSSCCCFHYLASSSWHLQACLDLFSFCF